MEKEPFTGKIIGLAIEAVSGIHKAQLLTYLNLSGIKTGLLINFNVQRLTGGIERFKL